MFFSHDEQKKARLARRAEDRSNLHAHPNGSRPPSAEIGAVGAEYVGGDRAIDQGPDINGRGSISGKIVGQSIARSQKRLSRLREQLSDLNEQILEEEKQLAELEDLYALLGSVVTDGDG